MDDAIWMKWNTDAVRVGEREDIDAHCSGVDDRSYLHMDTHTNTRALEFSYINLTNSGLN